MKKTTAKFPVQIGQSITCDFHENTWTFEMPKGFGFTGGKFAIITVEDYEQMKLAAVKSVCAKCAGTGRIEYNSAPAEPCSCAVGQTGA